MQKTAENMESGGSQFSDIMSGLEFGQFVPVAYFDSYLDCIRVMILDRSITEERKGEDLTLFRTNHPTIFDPKYCGFCLKGIRHLLDQIGAVEGEELRLTAVIDAFVKENPNTTVAKILGDFPANDDMIVEWDEELVA